ncbi:MAG: hypothetical protein HC915_00695 [Anaerolineae bacterium]|nr:hypothetical protein [Anaerolineae bacterium]
MPENGFADPTLNRATATGLVGALQLEPTEAVARLDIATGAVVVSGEAAPNPAPYNVGGNVQFQFELFNSSASTAYNVHTLVLSPSGGTLRDFLTGDPFPPDGVILQPFQRRTVTLSYTISATDQPGDLINRTLTAIACPEGQDPASCSAESVDGQTVSVLLYDTAADLAVSLSAPEVATLGQIIPYTVQITNISGQTINITGVQIAPGISTSVIPPQTLAQGEQLIAPPVLYTIPATRPGLPGDPLVATAQVTYAIAGTTTSGTTSASATTDVVDAGETLALSIQGPQSTLVGSEVLLRFVVQNLAQLPIRNAALIITPPTGCTSFEVSQPASAAGVAITSPMTYTLPLIAPRYDDLIARCQLSETSLQPGDTLVTSAALRLDGSSEDEATAESRIAITAAVDLTITSPAPVIPGGDLVFEYTVENFSQNEVSGLTIDATDPAECEGAFTRATSGPGAGLWQPGGATLAGGASLQTSASCTIPADFLEGQTPPVVITHSATLNINGVPQVTEQGTAQVGVPLEFTFLPTNAPSDVSTPTQADTPPEFLSANNQYELTYRLRNVGAGALIIEDIQATPSFAGTGPTLSCAEVEAETSFGGTFTGTLSNPGDYVTFTCFYRPVDADAGTNKQFSVDVSYSINGVDGVLLIDNPLLDADVEQVDLDVALLTDLTNPVNGVFNVTDNQRIRFTLQVTNTGTVPLTDFTFAQAKLNQETNTVITGSDTVLTEGTPVRNLTDLWEFNLSGGDGSANCPDPLPVNRSCSISATIPGHLINASNDLQYVVSGQDPNNFIIRVQAEAQSASGSGLETSDTAEVRFARQLPNVEIGGFGPDGNRNASGNGWTFSESAFSFSPNPAILGQNLTFTTTVRNTGSQPLSAMTLALTINNTTAAAPPRRSGEGMFVLTSGNSQGTAPTVTFPVTVNFTFDGNRTALQPNESVVARATWTVAGVTPPNTLFGRLRFTANVGGGFPSYDIQSDNFSIPVSGTVAAGTAAQNQTDPDGNPILVDQHV